MTQIQQQRLIGAALLASLIVLLAYFVLSKVGDNQADQQLSLPEPIEFSSIIEPLNDTFDSTETFVDADMLMIGPEESVIAQTNETEPATSSPQQAVTSSAPTPAIEPQPSLSVQGAPAPQVESPVAVAPPAPPAVPAPKPEATAPPTTPPAATQTQGPAWFIQVGSFSVQKNANDLKKKLEQLNYKPYIENSQTSSGLIYRVRLPASQNRAELEVIAARIQQELNLSPQIITQ